MTYRNRLLAKLPPGELALLAPHLERHTLMQGRVVLEPEQRIDAVWFPEDGVISQLSVMADGSAIETATVGDEGMVPLAPFHGVDVTPEHAFVQVAGSSHRLAASVFRELLPQCPTLVVLLHRYAQALFTFVAQSSGCNRKHLVDQRLARWLLLVHDRVRRDHFDLTQLFLSQMLGVRRATVTVAAGALQRDGIISYSRGRVTVLDRAALERASCECYAIVRGTFDRLVGDGVTGPSPLVGVRVTTADGGAVVGDGTPGARTGR